MRLLALLLTCCAVCCATLSGALAELFEPKGLSDGADPRVVNTAQAFKVFDTEFPSGTTLYATRHMGRLSLEQAFTNEYTGGNTVPAHLLQPLETYTKFGTVQAFLYHANITGALLANMSELVRANFWQKADFNATGGHLFTWVDQATTGASPKKNTFQLALFFDASSTYVVYNYHSVEFVLQNLIPIQAGFARRNSHEVALLPFSGAAALRLALASGTGDRAAGRFIYRVDAWPPIRGGCLSEDPPSEQDRRLDSTVTSDSVLGGRLAIVSGRCPDVGSTGTCHVTVEGREVAQRPATRCDRCGGVFWACEVPPGLRVGQARLSLRVTSQLEYRREFAFVSPDDPSVVRIYFNDSMDTWMQLEPAHLTISYEANSTLNGSLKLQIVGYSEAGLTRLDGTEDSAKLTKVIHEVQASSSGRMDLGGRAVRCPARNADCETYQVGFLRIVDSNTPANIIRSRLIPLGWFVHPYYLDKQSATWPSDKCRAWHDAKGAEVDRVRAELRGLACPGRLRRLLANPGGFLPMAYCPDLPGGCESGTPKQRCFVSRPVSGLNIQGVPASVCCYNDAEDLLYQEMREEASGTSWTQFSSTSLRSYPLGQPRSTDNNQPLLPGQASYLSHWYWDLLPRLHCCRWSSAGQCHLYYMQSRPSPRVSAYAAAGPTAHMVGDPHVTSYSGQRFLFNGYGEFWLLQSDVISVQARYQTLPVTAGAGSSATFLTALVARVGNRHLEVLPQGQLTTGSRTRFAARRWQDGAFDQALPVDLAATAASGEPYLDVGITAQLAAAQDSLVLQLTSGQHNVGLELRSPSGNFSYADLFLALSASLRERTRGLLGQWTADPAREFIDARGNIVAFNGNSSAFHAAFCAQNQMGNISESLFSYSGTSSRQQGFNAINVDGLATYRPVFDLPPAVSPQESVVCGVGAAADSDCVFDIRVTGSADVARATAATGKLFGELRTADNATGSSVCDVPAIAGIRLSQPPTVGSSLAIVCALPLRATRAVQPIVCTRQTDGNATWLPDPASLGVQCALEAPQVGQANVQLIVAIVVPLVVLILVAIVVVVFLVVRRRRAGQEQPGAYKPGTQVQMSQQQQSDSIHVQRPLLGGAKYSMGRQQEAQRTGGRPGGGGGTHDEVMTKSYPPGPDDGNRRNPRAAGAAVPPQYQQQHQQQQYQQQYQQPGYSSGISTSDVDVEGRAYAPVPAQRGSYERSQRNPVTESMDDGAQPAGQYQHQQPPGKPKPVVSHSEVV